MEQSGFRMKQLRKEAKLRAYEVARELGVHWVTVSRWERGVSKFSRADWDAVMKILNDCEKVYWIKSNRGINRKKS